MDQLGQTLLAASGTSGILCYYLLQIIKNTSLGQYCLSILQNPTIYVLHFEWFGAGY